MVPDTSKTDHIWSQNNSKWNYICSETMKNVTIYSPFFTQTAHIWSHFAQKWDHIWSHPRAPHPDDGEPVTRLPSTANIPPGPRRSPSRESKIASEMHVLISLCRLSPYSGRASQQVWGCGAAWSLSGFLARFRSGPGRGRGFLRLLLRGCAMGRLFRAKRGAWPTPPRLRRWRRQTRLRWFW